jgi:hypothetical protein
MSGGTNEARPSVISSIFGVVGRELQQFVLSAAGVNPVCTLTALGSRFTSSMTCIGTSYIQLTTTCAHKVPWQTQGSSSGQLSRRNRPPSAQEGTHRKSRACKRRYKTKRSPNLAYVASHSSKYRNITNIQQPPNPVTYTIKSRNLPQMKVNIRQI